MDLFKLVGTIAVKNAEANKAIDDTTLKAKHSEGKFKQFFNGIGKASLAVGKVVAVGLGVVATGIGVLTGKALKHYAEYEQLVGGVQTLFKDSSSKLIDYANQAYKTAGMSSNQYMDTVTSFSASLIQSLGGDTELAVEKANQAVIDMSDNANKMGTDIQSIQYAYQGFAKQNFTMLDNLKLGYGGTREEMERLLADAEKISGIHYDISSFADVTDAIHVIQESLGIAKTTANEAATTIQGSINSMKAAWTNFLTGMADPTQDFNKLLNSVIDSVVTVAENIIPRITLLLPRLIEGLSRIIQALATAIPAMIQTLLPALITGVVNLIQSIVDILPSLIDIIIQSVPLLLDAIIQVITALVEALPDIIIMIVDALPTLITQIVQGLMTALPILIEGNIQLILALVQALPQIIQGLVDAIPQIIQMLVEALIQCTPLLIQGGILLVVALVQALPQIIVSLIQAIPQIILAIVNGFKPLATQLIENAKTMLLNIANVFVEKWNQIKDTVSEKMEAIKSKIQSVLNLIKNVFSTVWENIKSLVKSKIDGIKSSITTGIENAKSTVSNTLEAIKNKFSSIFESAKNIVRNAIDRIKGFFDFSWSLPDIALPHFYISGSFSIMPPSVPHIGVDWYDKAMENGMIMDEPTIFGYNDATKQFMAGGESGSETVVGTNSLMNMIKTAVDNNNDKVLHVLHLIHEMLEDFIPELLESQNWEMVLDTGTLVGETAELMDEELGMIYKRGGRR